MDGRGRAVGLKDIHDYIAQDNPAAAEKVVSDIYQRAQILLEFPEVGYKMLKRKRKPRSVIELYMQFIMKGYLLFSEQDLLEALVKAGRFDVDNTDSAFLAEVCVALKDRR